MEYGSRIEDVSVRLKTDTGQQSWFCPLDLAFREAMPSPRGNGKIKGEKKMQYCQLIAAYKEAKGAETTIFTGKIMYFARRETCGNK
jgi:hypothetical protein